MKYIKNGIIFEPHNEFVEAQMRKNGYIPYEAKDVEIAPKEDLERNDAPKTETKKKKK